LFYYFWCQHPSRLERDLLPEISEPSAKGCVDLEAPRPHHGSQNQGAGTGSAADDLGSGKSGLTGFPFTRPDRACKMRARVRIGLYTVGSGFCGPGCLLSNIGLGLGLLLNNQKIQARRLCPKPRPARHRTWARSGPTIRFCG
jgi:hypothetical protein